MLSMPDSPDNASLRLLEQHVEQWRKAGTDEQRREALLKFRSVANMLTPTNRMIVKKAMPGDFAAALQKAK